jgi:hypothetical protein
MYHLQYLCQYQPVFRDVNQEYWDWPSVAAEALALLQNGRRAVRILNTDGTMIGAYDWNSRGMLMGQVGSSAPAVWA